MEIYNKKITPTEHSRGDLMLPMTKKHNSIWNDFLSKAGLAVALDMGTTKTWDVELRLQGAQSCTVQVVHHTRKMIKLPKTFMQDNNVTVGSKLSIACVLSDTSPLSGWLELSVAGNDHAQATATAPPAPAPAPGAAALAPGVAAALAPGVAAVAYVGVTPPGNTPEAPAAAAAALLPDSRSTRRARKPVKTGETGPASSAEAIRPQRKRRAPKALSDYDVHSDEYKNSTASSRQQKKVRVERAPIPTPTLAPAAAATVVAAIVVPIAEAAVASLGAPTTTTFRTARRSRKPLHPSSALDTIPSEVSEVAEAPKRHRTHAARSKVSKARKTAKASKPAKPYKPVLSPSGFLVPPPGVLYSRWAIENDPNYEDVTNYQQFLDTEARYEREQQLEQARVEREAAAELAPSPDAGDTLEGAVIGVPIAAATTAAEVTGAALEQARVERETAAEPAPLPAVDATLGAASIGAPIAAATTAAEVTGAALEQARVQRETAAELAPLPAAGAPLGGAVIDAPIAAATTAAEVTCAALDPLRPCRKRARDDTNELYEDISAMQPLLKRRRTSSLETTAEGPVSGQGTKALVSPETPDFENLDDIANLLLSMSRSSYPSVGPVPMEEDATAPIVETMPASRHQRAGGLRRQPRPSRRLLD